jgi:hypothetical protein
LPAFNNPEPPRSPIREEVKSDPKFRQKWEVKVPEIFAQEIE